VILATTKFDDLLYKDYYILNDDGLVVERIDCALGKDFRIHPTRIYRLTENAEMHILECYENHGKRTSNIYTAWKRPNTFWSKWQVFENYDCFAYIELEKEP